MNYLKLFKNHSQYEEFINGPTMMTPDVSHCVAEKDVHYRKKKFDDEYLTFEALESGRFTLTIGSGVTTGDVVSVSYSLDNGETWTTTNNVDGQKVVITTPTVNAGDEVLWKGNANRMANNAEINNTSTFSSTANFNARGNVMSLLYGDEFKGKVSLNGKNYCFYRLFGYNKKIINGKNISLPATTLANSCYTSMFNSCTSLTKAPELPATTLAFHCYDGMFEYCTSLTVAPELPATTLAEYCYDAMFYHCTNLTTAPELPATTLANYCYGSMFRDCTSLIVPPELPATTLTNKCYAYMFYGCTSLTVAPELPATTLASNCYNSMFFGCTNLTTAPELPATTLATYCYQYMFQDCTSLTVAPELPATTLTSYCYNNMFIGCTSLTVAPVLPATTLAQSCYSSMFYNCTCLTTAPELPATTLTSGCYTSMFYGCTSLTTAPELPATTLVQSCYENMFRACTTLNNIKMLSIYDYYTTTYLSDWVINVAAYGKYTMSESCLQKYLQGNKTLRSFIPKGWEVWYVDSNGDEHYVGINDEGGSNTYGYDYNYGYNYDYSYGYGYNGNGYDPLSGIRYPFDFYHDEDNTNIFSIKNTGSTSISPDIYFINHDNESCIFGEYHYGLVYSYDGYTYSDVPYKKSCPTTITIEPNQTIFLKGIMKPYSHGFDIYIGGQNMELGGNILSIVDPQNMENSIYDGTYTNSGANEYRFSGFESVNFTIQALEDNTIVDFSKDGLEYSVDGGTNWNSYSHGDGYQLSKGQKMQFRSDNTNWTGGTFSATTKEFIAYGNILSLHDGNNGDGILVAGLFKNSKIVDASCLIFPSASRHLQCGEMFRNCTTLTAAPELPATTLADNYCYSLMFQGCTSLTTAPKLPATTLTENCYEYMFYGCTSLTVAPELPATTLASNCYNSMFYGCLSLTTAPELPATTLANYCYNGMFYGCTNLTTAPELPATALTQGCYSDMFNNCTSLTTAPVLSATTLAGSCYSSMFFGCISLTTAPELPATTLADSCYNGMFRSCTSLTTAPVLSATTLASSCYSSMFFGCTSLTTAPALPATTLSGACYAYMFQGCTGLTTAPELPATTLDGNCYRYMFSGCRNLNYIKCLATDISANGSTSNWVSDVSSSGIFVKNANMSSWTTDVNGIPTGWTVQNVN